MTELSTLLEFEIKMQPQNITWKLNKTVWKRDLLFSDSAIGSSDWKALVDFLISKAKIALERMLS